MSSSSDRTPRSLLEDLRAPHPAGAWARFAHLYTPMLCRWANGLTRSLDERDELVQEVFLVLLNTLPTFRYDPDRGFRKWLYTVAAHKWREFHRKRRPASLGNEDPPATGDDPARVVGETEYRAELVSRARQLIQKEFAATTWLAAWATVADGRAAGEVAAELGMSVNAVYLARSRVLARLRIELEGLLD
jgi:RNA polymerase sigma-70 factor (ECF subfamily)